MRDYAGLTDHDFELLIADLFGTHEGVRYEAFARGPDLGVDLRTPTPMGYEAVQCKHYLNSRLDHLRAAARSEAMKLGRLDPAPRRYRFVTTRRLTAGNKDSLATDLTPFITSADDIWGQDDLELLLLQHPEVERRHIKLWLPSSTQLQAVVHSGVYARSKALIDEVMDAIPRWVPSKAFFEASAILKKERVCVIAGVPGIGKTMLARMLLADALKDGYELVHVSEDVEDAWKLYAPNTKQIFYYDDFLGRTSLRAQLGKNEEDRLLRLMRNVANSKTARFILTTREYILQQAKQLYEHLGREHSAERQFILQLRHYSRLDRARIFYNHAFVSGQLSTGARHALMTNEQYAKIIDHPAYNPRQIEWITGLSGHRLTDEDNGDYVTFAMAALNDPERIWRHAFENQLDAPQRALLMTLAGLPDRVELADLKLAFAAYCRESGCEATGIRFVRALEVLDNSFVETFQEDGHTFVKISNPSIEDFLLGYLRASEEDIRLTLKGALFFDQVRKLALALRVNIEGSSTLAADCLDACERCLEARSCSWYQVYYGRDAEKPTITRKPLDHETRAGFLHVMQTWGGELLKPGVVSRLVALAALGIKNASRQWGDGRGDKHETLRLLRQLSRDESVVDEAVLTSAKEYFTSNLFSPYAFSLLAELHDGWPELFEDAEWDMLREEFEKSAVDELNDHDQLRSVEDVEEIERYASAMGVALESNLLKATKEDVEKRAAEAAQHAYDQSADSPEMELPKVDEDDSRAEIAVLFVRLAND